MFKEGTAYLMVWRFGDLGMPLKLHTIG